MISIRTGGGYSGDGVQSIDPNELTGPNGFGNARWITVNQTLLYTIHFENDSTKATAPAQMVNISMNLDTTVDATSFQLMSFGFAGMTFSGAEGKGYYTQRLDVRDSLGLYVDATAGVDVTNRTIFWNFRSVDPNTGSAPTNPLVGMLPVNDAFHHGEGFVMYTIRPKSNAKTRDIIAPKASIIFDLNGAMSTPPTFNTIDAGAPSSSVQALTSPTSATTFTVHWMGADDATGSGVRSYSVYVSRNDSTFQPWLTAVTDTTAQFTGTAGSQYKFFSIATDNAGNIEPMKNTGEASIVITGVAADKNLPKSFALEQNYPNPFNPVTTIRYQLPVESRVTLKIYNILGQLVTTLVDGVQMAGYKTVVWRASSVASGVYFYRIEATSGKVPGRRFTEVKKMLLLK